MSKFKINTRLAEWKEEIIPLNDILEFYSTDAIHTKPTDRPYAWSMTVASIVGIISWKEKRK